MKAKPGNIFGVSHKKRTSSDERTYVDDVFIFFTLSLEDRAAFVYGAPRQVKSPIRPYPSSVDQRVAMSTL
ncbi:hypothetical protein GWI33_002442 [Rhynchophorus ferrugineus]|uniref:Uncharacterized protein n=1 Tax=Rhynchophorus ferrugineus TaxID=354439 RepID=A0A834IVI7_RHYFE|nr:hypothetical protein GWI33_002442 [Rhynchophorus ferrugineus]